jgi:hypothetical protein
MLNGQSEYQLSCSTRVNHVADIAQNSKAYTPCVSCHGHNLRRESKLTISQAKEIYNFLEARGRVEAYPLFTNVYRICWEGKPAEELTDGL